MPLAIMPSRLPIGAYFQLPIYITLRHPAFGDDSVVHAALADIDFASSVSQRDVLINVILDDTGLRPTAIVDAITVEHESQFQGERASSSFSSNDNGVQVFFPPDIFAHPTYVVLPRRYRDDSTVRSICVHRSVSPHPFFSSFSCYASVSASLPTLASAEFRSPCPLRV